MNFGDRQCLASAMRHPAGSTTFATDGMNCEIATILPSPISRSLINPIGIADMPKMHLNRNQDIFSTMANLADLVKATGASTRDVSRYLSPYFDRAEIADGKVTIDGLPLAEFIDQTPELAPFAKRLTPTAGQDKHDRSRHKPRSKQQLKHREN